MLAFVLASLTANPSNISDVIANARSGDTITLSAGDFGTVVIQRRFNKPVTLIAGDARIKVAFRNSSGIELRGGVVTGALGVGPAGYGISIQRSSNIRIAGARFSQSNRGLVISLSSDIFVSQASFTGMVIDGINVASSQRVVIRDNTCRDFQSGTAHPDCVQLWSRPNAVTTDVIVEGNRSIGRGMQGFTAFNHVRRGVNDGGFDRISIINNFVVGNYPQGVAVYDCRRCKVVGNRTQTLPEARHRVSINIIRCSECLVSNNVTIP